MLHVIYPKPKKKKYIKLGLLYIWAILSIILFSCKFITIHKTYLINTVPKFFNNYVKNTTFLRCVYSLYSVISLFILYTLVLIICVCVCICMRVCVCVYRNIPHYLHNFDSVPSQTIDQYLTYLMKIKILYTTL